MFCSSASTQRSIRAFTLIELLVVISIISVLLALILPSLKNARQAALAARCGSQLRQAGVSLMRYAYDYKEWGPHTVYTDASAFDGNWIIDYFPNPNVLRCPTDTVRPGTQGAIGGLMLRKNGDYQVLTSYFQLFAAGYYLGSTAPAASNYDDFFGWRLVTANPYYPVPNLRFMGTHATYVNKIGQTFTKTLQTPDLQAIAADGYSSNGVYFYGAVPNSTTYTNTDVGNNLRNVMHPEYDGINVQYGDGHVSWRKRSQLIKRFDTGSGLVTDIYW